MSYGRDAGARYERSARGRARKAAYVAAIGKTIRVEVDGQGSLL